MFITVFLFLVLIEQADGSIVWKKHASKDCSLTLAGNLQTLNNIKLESIQQCQQACEANAQCVAIVHSTAWLSNNKCYLKKSCGIPITFPGNTYFVWSLIPTTTTTTTAATTTAATTTTTTAAATTAATTTTTTAATTTTTTTTITTTAASPPPLAAWYEPADTCSTATLLEERRARSTADCASQCMMNQQCKSSWYDENSCRLYGTPCTPAKHGAWQKN